MIISVAAITGRIPVPELIGMDDDVLLKKAAFLLRQHILAFVDKVPSLPWPPTVDTLLGSERQPPEEVTSFISHVLTSTKHKESHQISQLSKSFSEDLIYGVTRGKFLTAKHALVGVVLHNMTGQKVPVNILFRLGNSCSYDQVCEMETGLAELSQYFQAESQLLPLQTISQDSTVLTVFWMDNFDQNIETVTGHGAIHNTHGVAYQEISDGSIYHNAAVEIP